MASKVAYPADRPDVEITILDRFLAGDSVSILATDYDMSSSTVEYIIRRRISGVRRVLR